MLFCILARSHSCGRKLLLGSKLTNPAERRKWELGMRTGDGIEKRRSDLAVTLALCSGGIAVALMHTLVIPLLPQFP